jgi:4-hydroxy-tetrahydrodipicolinate synthase
LPGNVKIAASGPAIRSCHCICKCNFSKCRFIQACREGAGGASPAVERLRLVGETVDRLTFPLNVAAGMEARGVPVGAAKALVSPASRAIHTGIVRELRAAFKEWGLPAFSQIAQAAAWRG